MPQCVISVVSINRPVVVHARMLAFLTKADPMCPRRPTTQPKFLALSVFLPLFSCCLNADERDKQFHYLAEAEPHRRLMPQWLKVQCHSLSLKLLIYRQLVTSRKWLVHDRKTVTADH